MTRRPSPVAPGLPGARRPHVGGGLLLATLLLGSCASAPRSAEYAAMEALGPADWAADLRHLARELPRRHPRFRREPELARRFAAAAAEAVAELEAAADSGGGPGDPGAADSPAGIHPALGDRMIARVAALLGTVGEGHTVLGSYSPSRFPLSVRWFPVAGGGSEARLLGLDPAFAAAWEPCDEACDLPLDGAAELEARNPRPVDPAEAIGARILGLYGPAGFHSALEPGPGRDAGSDPADLSLAELIDPTLSLEAEAPQAARVAAARAGRARRLGDPRIMAGLGLALPPEADEGPRRLRLLVETESGRRLELELGETGGEPFAPRSARGARLPFASSRPEERWSARLDRDGGPDPKGPFLFINYSRCDLAARPFFDSVLEELARGGVEGLIVDLRANGGGSSLPGTAFAAGLAKLPRFREPGRVIVLMGPSTFSSAMMLVVDLREKVGARLAGQALAELPDSWGEVKTFALPNSGLLVGHSTRFFAYGRGKELGLAGGALAPDPGLEYEPDYEDWLLGRDPLLDLAVEALGRFVD